MREEKPIAAFALSLAGGVMIFVGGLFLAVVSSVAGSIGASGLSAAVGGLSIIGLLIGFLVIVFAGLLYESPEHHTPYGIVIVILSAVSIFGGGGFLIGIILGLIGGVLAIRFEVDEDPNFEWEYNGVRPSIPGSSASRPTPRMQGLCANCQSTVPVGADRCPNCETPYRPPSRPERGRPTSGAAPSGSRTP
ncbi:MAG: DUF6114 domain-containing protein [Thermoplasmata archaeon]|nr:DUF6114 domain-containing protein [Thermoplasmata archaeon]MCI4355934.1 DUF6114 domain-containing protein [Thermoplasmata archaeon]